MSFFRLMLLCLYLIFAVSFLRRSFSTTLTKNSYIVLLPQTQNNKNGFNSQLPIQKMCRVITVMHCLLFNLLKDLPSFNIIFFFTINKMNELNLAFLCHNLCVDIKPILLITSIIMSGKYKPRLFLILIWK